jgi:hypothetical protein
MEFVQFPILDRQITLMSGFRCIGTGVNLVLEEALARVSKDGRTAREAWVRVPGKHRNKDAAWAALENMIATRH